MNNILQLIYVSINKNNSQKITLNFTILNETKEQGENKRKKEGGKSKLQQRRRTLRIMWGWQQM